MNDIEQQFFKVFGIEPKTQWHKCKDYSCIACDEYDNCVNRKYIYPEITAEKLIELICALNALCEKIFYKSIVPNDFKNEILSVYLDIYPKLLKKDKEYLREQVRSLFEVE